MIPDQKKGDHVVELRVRVVFMCTKAQNRDFCDQICPQDGKKWNEN